jgi:hypothetical protein
LRQQATHFDRKLGLGHLLAQIMPAWPLSRSPADYQLVTTDMAFQQHPGLDLLLLT